MPRESIVNILSRVRPSTFEVVSQQPGAILAESLEAQRQRVHLTYEVDMGGGIQIRELPFVLGVLSDLTPQPLQPLPRLRDRKFIQVDVDNLDSFMHAMQPSLALKTENKLSEDGSDLAVSLLFSRIDDFEPENLVRQIPALRMLLELRTQLSDLRVTLSTSDRLAEILSNMVHDQEYLESLKPELELDYSRGLRFSHDAEEPSGLWRIVENAGIARDRESTERHCRTIACYIRELLAGNIETYRDPEIGLSSRIYHLDDMISRQLSEIMHHPDFQRLEASWRMLAYLVRNTETSDSLKIKVLNASKKELVRDAERAAEFDQSALFKKVYEDEFGVFGGEPYAALIGDYEFAGVPYDVYLLEKLSQVAAAAHAPFIAGASPDLLGLENFTQIDLPRDLAHMFDGADYARWRHFRQNEDARYVSLVLPRILVRLPYGRDSVPVLGFNFDERMNVADHSVFLWGNPAFALAQRLAAAFAKYGWTAAIRGVEGGGVVSNLPVFRFMTDTHEIAVKCPTEISIADRREKELATLGLIPLVHCKGTDFACFFSVPTCQKPPIYDNEFANAVARAAAQLPFVLAVSRFCHYLKAMMRDKTAVFSSRAACEQYLNQWLSRYVSSTDIATSETRARFPLKSGRIDVRERRDAPGNYRAAVFLLPNFQLQGLNLPIRTVVELHGPRH